MFDELEIEKFVSGLTKEELIYLVYKNHLHNKMIKKQ